jgi:hypothetical protein
MSTSSPSLISRNRLQRSVVLPIFGNTDEGLCALNSISAKPFSAIHAQTANISTLIATIEAGDNHIHLHSTAHSFAMRAHIELKPKQNLNLHLHDAKLCSMDSKASASPIIPPIQLSPMHPLYTVPHFPPATHDHQPATHTTFQLVQYSNAAAMQARPNNLRQG